MAPPDDRGLSRRELLKRAAILGVAATTPVCALSTVGPDRPLLSGFQTLTPAQSRTLEAIVARLIPTDENGPGATEARAAHYIDRALGGALAASRDAYGAGLAAVDAYAQASRGAPFAELPPGAQDAVLTDMERSAAPGFSPDSAAFFNLVRAHTIEGTFCDPAYGGNASFVGWELLAYPGLRLAVGADEQRLDGGAAPRYRSAYDLGPFPTPQEHRGH